MVKTMDSLTEMEKIHKKKATSSPMTLLRELLLGLSCPIGDYIMLAGPSKTGGIAIVARIVWEDSPDVKLGEIKYEGFRQTPYFVLEAQQIPSISTAEHARYRLTDLASALRAAAELASSYAATDADQAHQLFAQHVGERAYVLGLGQEMTDHLLFGGAMSFKSAVGGYFSELHKGGPSANKPFYRKLRKLVVRAQKELADEEQVGEMLKVARFVRREEARSMWSLSGPDGEHMYSARAELTRLTASEQEAEARLKDGTPRPLSVLLYDYLSKWPDNFLPF